MNKETFDSAIPLLIALVEKGTCPFSPVLDSCWRRLNSENWFAYGLYKALLPLATESFDNSIQAKIAEQCFNRLSVDSFDSAELASRLELDKKYTDQDLYDDEHLATRLVNNAYDYLKTFGIDYVLVVLDELETAAEAATFGLETNDLKRLDGRAIKLMGQAIKEEDPRRKLPWLRYVALCSPAIGEELREISSTARRFELVDLEHNAFADVSDYVASLKNNNRLIQSYERGLVEAAYAMSSSNFGWFNVVMANIDEVLNNFRISQEKQVTPGKVFSALIKSSSRIRDYVLDAGAITSLKTTDPSFLSAATELLYGQLPVALDQVDEITRQLATVLNEYDEPVTMYFRKVQWDYSACRKALAEAKFVRVKGDYLWALSGIEQALNLRQLLANLATYAIHEGAETYLI